MLNDAQQMCQWMPDVVEVKRVTDARVRVNRTVKECAKCPAALPPTIERPGRAKWSHNHGTWVGADPKYVVVGDVDHVLNRVLEHGKVVFGTVGMTACGGDGEMVQAACRPNLMMTLDAMNVAYALVTKRAWKAVRLDVPVERVAGEWFIWKDRFMGMVEPNRGDKQGWLDGIESFIEAVKAGMGTELLTGKWCVKCGNGVKWMDENGLGWCGDHFTTMNPGITEKEWAEMRVKVQPVKRESRMTLWSA